MGGIAGAPWTGRSPLPRARPMADIDHFEPTDDHAHRPDGLDHLTISLGGGLSSAPGLAHPQDLLARCDQLLYQAKQAGRNQARLASHA